MSNAPWNRSSERQHKPAPADAKPSAGRYRQTAAGSWGEPRRLAVGPGPVRSCESRAIHPRNVIAVTRIRANLPAARIRLNHLIGASRYDAGARVSASGDAGRADARVAAVGVALG